MKSRLFLIALTILLVLSGCTQAREGRKFLSHRGVHVRMTAAGENSLEAVRMTRLAGFKAIETDVRWTSDSVLAIMHDQTLNRTCLKSDGTPIDKPVSVEDCTMAQLKSDYILKCAREDMRTRIPTLEEFLKECKKEGLQVFIEPKVKDTTGRFYLDIMACADTIFGRGNYIVTSSNFANTIIRDSLHIYDVPLMGVLYQTTYEDIVSKSNIIMAISTSRFKPEEYAANVRRSKADGLVTESHADNFKHFDMINNAEIDYVSTDLLAADWDGHGKTLLHVKGGDVAKALKASEKCSAVPQVQFGAIYLEMDFVGTATVTLLNQKFKLSADELRHIQHQLVIVDKSPVFELSDMSDDFILKSFDLRVVRY